MSFDLSERDIGCGGPPSPRGVARTERPRRASADAVPDHAIERCWPHAMLDCCAMDIIEYGRQTRGRKDPR